MGSSPFLKSSVVLSKNVSRKLQRMVPVMTFPHSCIQRHELTLTSISKSLYLLISISQHGSKVHMSFAQVNYGTLLGRSTLHTDTNFQL